MSPGGRTFCPARGFWAANRDRLTHGDFLFLNTPANSFGRKLKKITRELEYEDGKRYSENALRRGATQEIRNSGSTFSTVLRSGIWTSGGYKCRLDPHADETVNISALLASPLETASDDPDEPPPAARRDKAMGSVRRLLKMPIQVGHPPTIAYDLPRGGGSLGAHRVIGSIRSHLNAVLGVAIDAGPDPRVFATLFE